jgi:hypothetical protein
MLRRVGLIRTDVSEDLRASIIRVTRIGELITTLAQLATDTRYEEVRNSDHWTTEEVVARNTSC